MGGLGSSPTVLNTINGPPGQGMITVSPHVRLLANITMVLGFIIALLVALHMWRREPPPRAPSDPECDRETAWARCLNSLNGRSDCDAIWDRYC